MATRQWRQCLKSAVLQLHMFVSAELLSLSLSFSKSVVVLVFFGDTCCYFDNRKISLISLIVCGCFGCSLVTPVVILIIVRSV